MIFFLRDFTGFFAVVLDFVDFFFLIFCLFKEEVGQRVGLPALLPYCFALSPRTESSGSSQASPRGFERYQKDMCGTRGGDSPKNSDKVISLEACADSIRGTKEKNLKVKEQFGHLLKL